MPFSIPPSQVRDLIPTTSGSRCSAFKKLMSPGVVLDALVSYFFDEAGFPSDQFKVDTCAIGCVGGGGGGNANMPAPTNLSASDDGWDDKIRVTWDTVTSPNSSDPVERYEVYRSAVDTNTDPALATLVATVYAPLTTFDDPVDDDLEVGINYRYWAKARSLTQTSGFSIFNDGRAAAPSGDIDAVADLRATVGFGATSIGPIALVWTPPTGATRYDIYQGTTNVYADATKIYADVVPSATTQLNPDSFEPECWDNVGEIVLYHYPRDTSGPVQQNPEDYPLITGSLYYWVVAKRNSPPAVSFESNSALGAMTVPGISNQTGYTLDFDSDTYTVQAGETKLYVVLKGSGGGGAGGNDVYGGGGGGGGGTVVEQFTVIAGDVVTFVLTGNQPDSGNAVSTADGDDGALLEIQINAVTKMTSTGGHGGGFSPSGGGAGGLGDTGTGDIAPTVYDGKPGLPADGANGGRSGYQFSGRRLPRVKLNSPQIYNGNASVGSGASAWPFEASLAVGGYGLAGSAVIRVGN